MKAADITNLRFSSYEPVEDFMYSLSVYNKDKFDTGYIGNGAWRILSLKKENEDSNEIISYKPLNSLLVMVLLQPLFLAKNLKSISSVSIK